MLHCGAYGNGMEVVVRLGLQGPWVGEERKEGPRGARAQGGRKEGLMCCRNVSTTVGARWVGALWIAEGKSDPTYQALPAMGQVHANQTNNTHYIRTVQHGSWAGWAGWLGSREVLQVVAAGAGPGAAGPRHPSLAWPVCTMCRPTSYKSHVRPETRKHPPK